MGQAEALERDLDALSSKRESSEDSRHKQVAMQQEEVEQKLRARVDGLKTGYDWSRLVSASSWMQSLLLESGNLLIICSR